MCFAMAFSMIGSMSAPYWVWISCWMACSRNAPPALETLIPSLSAIRSSSAFTTGLTHNVSLTVFRLAVGLFCEREVVVLIRCARMSFLSDAGCGEAMRARGGAGLSCHTLPRSCCDFSAFDRWGNVVRDDWV